MGEERQRLEQQHHTVNLLFLHAKLGAMFGDIQTAKMTDISSLKEMRKERQVEGEGKEQEKYIEKKKKT